MYCIEFFHIHLRHLGTEDSLRPQGVSSILALDRVSEVLPGHLDSQVTHQPTTRALG